VTTTACYACGAAVGERRIGAADVGVCPACGFGQVVRAEHAPDYWARTDDVRHEMEERYWMARLAVYQRALATVERVTGPGRLADLGGGVGHFAQYALERGWDAYSLDVSEHATAAAAARVGAHRSFRVAPAALAGTCDVVTLWCVIAHVPDPGLVLADALGLLKPGGRLLLTTPNFRFQAPYAWLTARLGRPLDFVASDHLLHFTAASLERVLDTAGAGRRTFTYWGTTGDCLLERRLARPLVPCKRLWNWTAWRLARRGGPALHSELQVEVFRW